MAVTVVDPPVGRVFPLTVYCFSHRTPLELNVSDPADIKSVSDNGASKIPVRDTEYVVCPVCECNVPI